MSWPVKSKHPRNSLSSTTPSNAFTFTALSKLEPISGSSTTSPYRSSSSNIAKGSEPPVVALRSAFNATAPANHLPSELVVEIFSSGSWSRWQELVALTHICQHWRNVALGTPHLWAVAVRSIFAGKCRWCQCGDHNHIHWPKCLPAFLARSEPFPLNIDLPDYMRLVAELLNPEAVLKPHVSRVAHLSVEVTCADGIKAVLQLVHAHIRGLESLRMRMPQRQDQLAGTPFSLDELPSWEDEDLPCLHTLAVPGHYFGSAIAVASLRTLVLCKGPRNHRVFLAALERCGPSLESLTLQDWSHPEPTTSDATRTVQLPRLRHLKVALSNTSSDSATPALLFATLSFPPTVVIDLGWASAPGNTRELLPKDLVGLHAPPFFDSMCLHLFGNPRVAGLHCYLGDTERLCVQGQVIADPPHASGLSFGGFPDAHPWPTVTRLAVDLDMQSADGCAGARGDLLRAFLGGFPRLRRLDLFGKTVGDVKLQMVDAFLDPTYSYSYPYSPTDTSAAGAGAGKTLAYVCEVSEHRKALRSVGMVDDFRAQLDALEALLASRLSSTSSSTSHGNGPGPRLRRLELCITYSSSVPHPPPRHYPRIQDVPFSTVLTAYLSSIYAPRFRALPGVDEVVFVGDCRARVPGYRVVSQASRQPPGSTRPNCRGEKRTAAGRKGR